MTFFDEFPLQHDANGDPFIWVEGDMGIYVERSTGHRNAVTGADIRGRFVQARTAKFTGGIDAAGAPTLAKGHPPIEPADIPANIPWPSSLGDDPR